MKSARLKGGGLNLTYGNQGSAKRRGGKFSGSLNGETRHNQGAPGRKVEHRNMRKNKQLKPVLVLVTDRYGDVIYPPPVKMMRDHIGLSQRQLTQQATRETMPRDVTPRVPAPKAPDGWIARLMARVWR